ncbi:hypothetical protein M0R45_016494 [Rubus argutus]|uniref:Uncharacterized protein n=1 Tax=Rubus argutus TaxID=59490 RepID=A0AAW1XV78_RUBAR
MDSVSFSSRIRLASINCLLLSFFLDLWKGLHKLQQIQALEPATPGSTIDGVVGALVLVTQPTQGTPVPPSHAQTLVPLDPLAKTADDFGTKRKNKSEAWEHFTKLKNVDGSVMQKP